MNINEVELQDIMLKKYQNGSIPLKNNANYNKPYYDSSQNITKLVNSDFQKFINAETKFYFLNEVDQV